MAAVREHKVVVCKGETGSGKTTQFPQYLRDAFDPPGLIGVTQPRRVAAVSVATRVAQERRGPLGEEVGYQIRFEDRTGPRTRIKFMTDGCLVRECLEDPTLRRYSFIMLDEAHERSVNTDILFGLMKRALAIRDDLRVVVTSATLDVHKFSDYFDRCPVKEIPVRTHPVSVYHSKTKVREGAGAGGRERTVCLDGLLVVCRLIRFSFLLCSVHHDAHGPLQLLLHPVRRRHRPQDPPHPR